MTERLDVYLDAYHGKLPPRDKTLYADICVAETGALLIASTMPYALEVIRERGFRVIKRTIPIND